MRASLDSLDFEPFTLSIKGDYWDSQVYKGRLHLWNTSATWYIYNWDAFVKNYTDTTHLGIGLAIALSSGDYMYRCGTLLLEHDDARQFLLKSMQNIAGERREITQEELKPFQLARLDLGYSLIPIDSDIYGELVVATSDSGSWILPIGQAIEDGQSLFPVVPAKFSSDPALAVRAASGSIALAMGREGLWEYEIPPVLLESARKKRRTMPESMGEARLLSRTEASYVNWAYSSIVSSSYSRGVEIAAFRWEDTGNTAVRGPGNKHRQEVGVVSSEQILGVNHVRTGWGCQDKVYMLSGSSLASVRYQQRSIRTKADLYSGKAFQLLKPIDLGKIYSVVKGGVGHFGIVLDTEDGLEVRKSSGGKWEFTGEFARWRIFPKSRHYVNQMHVVSEESLDIVSFLHDYFVEQGSKTSGVRFEPDWRVSL